MKISRKKIIPYVTKNGSVIRELIHPSQQGRVTLSIAEATVNRGCTILMHIHVKSNEVYYILEGNGLMTLGDERFKVLSGDCILIKLGTPHRIENTGVKPLKILCCCNPPYDHQDTHLMDDIKDGR